MVTIIDSDERASSGYICKLKPNRIGHIFFLHLFHFVFSSSKSPILITMSDDESIFLNQSVSQINDNDSAFTDRSHLLSENTSNSEKSKSIGAYLIAQNDPACLLARNILTKVLRYLSLMSCING